MLKVESDTYTMVLKCDKFLPIASLSDARFTKWLDQVNRMDWSGYELWVYGGLLHKTRTRDIDASLVGEWDPKKIRLLLDGMYQAAFELQLMPDIKYQTREQLTQPDSSLESAYPPGLLIMEGKRQLCGKLGDGNLRWKKSPIRTILPPQQLI